MSNKLKSINNAGFFTCCKNATLNTKNEEEVLTINMVVQVAKSEDNNNGGGDDSNNNIIIVVSTYPSIGSNIPTHSDPKGRWILDNPVNELS